MIPSMRVCASFSALAFACLGAGSSVVADEDAAAFDRTPRECVQLHSVARTDILDDQTIVFYMRGNKVAYRNYLPRKCPGLKRWDRFAYNVTAGRLCNIDVITVLEQWGTRFEPGFTCQLGDFHPLSPGDIESLKEEKQGGPRPDSVRTRPAKVRRDEPAAPIEPVEEAVPPPAQQ